MIFIPSRFSVTENSVYCATPCFQFSGAFEFFGHIPFHSFELRTSPATCLENNCLPSVGEELGFARVTETNSSSYDVTQRIVHSLAHCRMSGLFPAFIVSPESVNSLILKV